MWLKYRLEVKDKGGSDFLENVREVFFYCWFIFDEINLSLKW